MAVDVSVEIRPRSTGEVLDDAWRLYLADAPLLLALDSLFLVPAAAILLLLLTQPRSSGTALLLGAAAAVLLPLTGIGSGACQEVFRARAAGTPVSLAGCLWAALRCGLDHAAARALVLGGTLLGLAAVVIPGLAVSVSTFAVHPLLAGGEVRLRGALAGAAHEAQRTAAKAGAVLLARVALLAFAVLNLHVLGESALWVGENFAGLDVAFLDVLLSLTNPVYLVALVLLAGLLLAPFGEACNYLLHVDTRARYEGLDLWYRIQRLFPAVEKSRAGAALLALGWLLLGPPLRADDRLDAVRAARQEVAAVTAEVRQAEPYPGGERWLPRLRAAAERLKQADPAKAKRAAWFDKALTGFAGRDRQGALDVLAGLDQDLALAEEALLPAGEGRKTPDEVRRLLPEKSPDAAAGEAKDIGPKQKEVKEVRVKRDDPAEDGPGGGGGGGSGLVAPAPAAGFGPVVWLFLAGLFLAFVVVALVLFLRERRAGRPAGAPHRPGQPAPSLTSLLNQPEPQTPAALWKQADALAGEGKFLDALRSLYLGVLALLHRARLIRYERTRTNGEYVRQVRLAEEAPPELHDRFRRLTALFDGKWYGDHTCDGREFELGRSIAEEIKGEVS